VNNFIRLSFKFFPSELEGLSFPSNKFTYKIKSNLALATPFVEVSLFRIFEQIHNDWSESLSAELGEGIYRPLAEKFSEILNDDNLLAFYTMKFEFDQDNS
jgi:hypothetical protein